MKWKGYAVIVNWALSIIGLAVDMDSSPLGVVLVLLLWFYAATALAIYADKHGWFDSNKKKPTHRIDEQAEV